MTTGETSGLIRAAALQGPQLGPDWNFAVPPGGALWIPDSDDDGMAWLDWLTGIEPPPGGAVFWKGVDWTARSPDEAAAERGRIGCVFGSGGLLANLDMDENVWLPSRIHRRADAGEAIERWARFFGCWPLPPERAPAVPEQARRRILWTRAFAGSPELLVLEHPLRETSAEDRRRLLEAVAEARRAGAAVVWLDDRVKAETRSALEPLAEAAPAPA